MNNQYSTTYTGSETSVPIYKPANSRGNGNIQVKCHATGYVDSDNRIKQIWFGKPAVYSFGNHLIDISTGMPMYDFCYDTHNDCEAVHPAGNAFIDGWEWQVTGASIYTYGSQYRCATIYPNDYSSFGVEIRAHNACGYSEWSRMWVSAINCNNGYYMIMTPNPANDYVELVFIEESDVKNKSNKLKIKGNKSSKDTLIR